MICVYWLFENKKSRCESILNIFSTIGLFIIASLSVSIQFLNTFPTSSNGMIQVADPAKFNRMSYATDKYLKDVGIYTKWPIDQAFNYNSNISIQKNDNSYIFLANITEIVDNTYISVNLRSNYSLNNNSYTMCFTKLGENNCYSIRNESIAKKFDTLTSSSILASDSYLNQNGYEIGLMKEPAQNYKYKIGYLDYNLIRITTNSSASGQNCSPTTAISLIYAKFSNSRNDSFLKSDIVAPNYSFYSLDFDLLTVDKFWRTGIIGCEMSGDLGPKLSRNIRLLC
jgi:hypothetical protein